MTIHTSLTSAKAWAGDVIAVAPIDAVPDALILKTSTVAGSVAGDSPAVRVQYVEDADAGFVAEGTTIDDADPDLAETLVYTGKIAQLIRLSREQFSQPNADALLAASVARSVTRAANIAYIAQAAPESPSVTPPAGLLNIDDILDGDPVTDSLDALIDLQAEIASNDGNATHIVLSPTAWADLRKLKDMDTSNRSLIGAGTADADRMLLNLPVLVSNAVPAHTGLMLDKSAIVSAVGSIMVATSDQAYFAADSIGIRCTWRFGANLVHPERVGSFTIGGDES